MTEKTAEATNVYDLDLPEIDVFSEEYGNDPHHYLAEARKQHWLAKYPMGFIVLDQQGIIDVNRADDDMRTPLRSIVPLFGAEGTAWGDWMSNTIIAMDHDEEAYQRIRRIAAPAFTPKVANQNRELMRDTINHFIDGIIDKGECDFDEDVGRYPIASLCRIIGFPMEDVVDIEEWVRLFEAGYGMDPSILPTLDAGLKNLKAYVRKHIDARMQPGDHPDDLVQQLIGLATEGEKMSETELENLLMLMLSGGYDSTKQTLNMCVYMMAKYPEEAKKLAEDPSRVRRFMEETLRYMGTTGATHRVTRGEFTYRGVVFPEGTFMTLAHVGAGRDPELNDDPDTFNPDRKKVPYTQFGQGAHMCLGMFLAKAEVEEALKVIVERMENIRVTGDLQFEGALGFWGLKKLPISFDRKA